MRNLIIYNKRNNNINNFVFLGAILNRYFQLKSTFTDEKFIRGEIWDTL